ncbi:extracellular solute-binding protein [Paenibacillus sp. IB182496]|uniref:Extracellular solute-binding protein n=1 Tax=Paenibacillus sabuli TaxID=2772509 RepID=A0A927BW74_9BACL|nr:extracellular solute-binding protein [Paenibacillus sabuli]MBD2847991.1 extracellular solute-binding protein [Paenibacillus sabuli]
MRNMPNKRKLSLLLLLSLVLVLAACSGGNNAPGNSTGNTGGNAGANANGNAGGSGETAPVKLTYWVAMDGNASRSLGSYSEMLFFQELEKRTGVEVEFQHPAVGSEKEQFNLMIASGNLPDVIESDFTAYPGGPEKAIADQVLIPLNDVIDEHAPNLKAYLDEHPEFRKEIVTDDGTIYVFPSIGIGNRAVSGGLMLRQDWLDELGLDVPVTMDDWTNVLRAFKEKGAAFPFTARLGTFNATNAFNGAYGVGQNFYQKDGQVKYAPLEPGYKDYLAQLNAWYEEGLLDPDFATQDAKAHDAKVSNGDSGAFFAYIGSGMGRFLNAMEGQEFDLVGAPYPVLNEGEEPYFVNKPYEYRGGGSAGITPNNEHVAETAEWLDYLYSDEGHILKSFGIEGETFNMVDGDPQYSELIMDNPDGLSIGEAMGKYLRVSTPTPGLVGDDRYAEQYYEYEQQKKASATYSEHQDNADQVLLPRISQTPDEANELSAIMAEVQTYQDEMLLKFIMGSESLEDGYEAYTEQLRKMNIERAIELKQAALERYKQR